MMRGKRRGAVRRLGAWAPVLALVAAALLANDGGQAAQMQTCTISTTPLKFGRYDPRQPVDLIVSGSVAFNCSRGQPITIIMDQGSGRKAAMREMRYRNRRLEYQIYFDPTATRIWGDGTGGSQFYSNNAPPVRTTVVIPFYGRIPAGQSNLVAGTYRDSVVVKVIY
ncbi:MAG TPA: spore coat U domain-containing protein [Stellaceae bacterium]|nr:spore coat U domain-containing protein [Stellaceae bacterium]